MAKAPATAKTPTVAIARVLRGLGLKQGTDFSVSGEYRQSTGGYGRERIGTFVTLYTTLANETVAEHADAIETATETDGGWSFDVSIRYGKRSGNVFCDIANFGERTREAAPVTEAEAQPVAMVAPVAEVPAAGETTKEEKVAAVAKRFPRGTRVQGVDSYGVTCAGTVDGTDYGMVTDTNHANYGRVYLGVTWDEMPHNRASGRRSRPFADELLAPAAEVDPVTLVGNRYAKPDTHYRNGYPEAFTMVATVREIIRGYTDPWTGEHHAAGVRFSILDDSRDWTSYHTLSLADFLKHWASA